MYFLYELKRKSDPGQLERLVLYDTTQETGCCSTGSDSAARQQSMRE